MSKIYKTITKQYQSEEVETVTCDICGTGHKGEKWSGTDVFEVNETTFKIEIKHKTGDCYPEGGSGEELEIDICPKCFKDKLIPWVTSHLQKPLIPKDWDF